MSFVFKLVICKHLYLGLWKSYCFLFAWSSTWVPSLAVSIIQETAIWQRNSNVAATSSNASAKETLQNGRTQPSTITLILAYLLMLCNDGKNYAQLEHAGLDTFVDNFIKSRLWEGRETNQGWPLDNIFKSSALWLMWMTLTKRWSFSFFWFQ